jgi:hypothetical protein
MNPTGHTRTAAAITSRCDSTRRTRRGSARRGGLSLVVTGLVLAAAVLMTGGASERPVPTALEQDPHQPPCIAGNEALPRVPLAGAVTSTLSATPVRLTGAVSTAGSRIAERTAITDFPAPAATATPRQTIVLLEYTVHSAAPEGWAPGNSLALFASKRLREGFTMTSVICPLDLSATQGSVLGAAMRAAGHVPLPDLVRRGQTATGWVAFRIQRTFSALTLREQIRNGDGYSGGDSPLYEESKRPGAQTRR